MTKFCLGAAEEALTMAQWKPQNDEQRLRTGNFHFEGSAFKSE